MPLIPYYIALKRTQDIINWTYGKTGKAIESPYLYLYEKVYLLVHSCEDLRNHYVIRLGELHIVFAMVSSVGTNIERSRTDQSCFKLGYFSENTMHQVCERKGPFLFMRTR